MSLNKLLKSIIIKLLTGGSEPDYTALASKLTLKEAIGKIDQLFGCETVLNEFNSDITISYYTQSEWGYQVYHSGQDAIHMALNPDGVFDPDGYYAQPRVVAEQIHKLDAKNVLELGCGKGFNSFFLAENNPHINFTGIDLTPLHIQIANRKAQKFSISNLTFQEGNFNTLQFPDKSFDIVFAFECLCHAEEVDTPLAEIFRVLRPGGQLIVFDGYRKTKLEKLSSLMQTATQLVEVSMAVRHGFPELDDYNTIAKSVGFHIREIEDNSLAIQPTLSKLQKLAIKFFHLTSKAKKLTSLLPKYLVRNAIAGLLMPFAVSPKGEAFGYYKLILERPFEGF